MFVSGSVELLPWEISDAAWESQLEELIRRDPGGPDEPLPDDPRFADDPAWDVAAADSTDDAGVDPAALPDAAIIDMITALQRDVDRAGARQARLLAEFARRRPDPAPKNAAPDRRPGFSRWAPDEIALALSLSRVTALVRLAQAVQLRDVLPAVLDAWESGRIDVLKVRAITDACLRVRAELAPAVADRVLPRAAQQTVAQLSASLKRAVIAVDPEGANERHAEATRKRRVVLNPDEDGMSTLWAYLSAPQAMTAYGWLTALARGLGKDDPRTMDERRTDLFAALLTGSLTVTPPTGETATADSSHGATSDLSGRDEPAGDAVGTTGTDVQRPTATGTDRGSGSPPPPPPAPTGPAALPQPVNPGKPLVHVLVPITTLHGTDQHPVELVGYGPVPAALARDIAADGIWKRLVTDPLSGALLDHGRTTYRPPTATAEFVRARDVHCRFPTCRRRALDSELDHTRAWTTDQGDTCDTNLYDACPHHHHLRHDAPGWTVSQHPDGTIIWTTPTGHRYSTQPYDYRPEPHLPNPARAAPPPERERSAADPRSPFDRDLDAPDDAPF